MNADIVQRAAIFVQAHLDERLDLARLAEAAELSPHHFHRLFARATGETPARFVQRLRLEKAAYRLLVHNDPIVAVALDCGYASHETFARAFHRLWGKAPREYRRHARLAIAARREPEKVGKASGFELSSTRVAALRPLPIAYVRLSGPYEEIDTGAWSRLNIWADRRGHPAARLQIGIGHDAPGITEASKLRFDACITVPEGTRGETGIHVGRLPELRCAVTSHVGSFATLPAAYPEIFGRAAGLKGYEIVGLPAIEIYRDPAIGGFDRISCTDIYLPIHRKGEWNG